MKQFYRLWEPLLPINTPKDTREEGTTAAVNTWM